jgi:hypothetical protein
MIALLPGACKVATSTDQQPIQVVSVSGPLPSNNFGGPNVEVTLKNVFSESVVSMTASLGVSRTDPSNMPFVFIGIHTLAKGFSEYPIYLLRRRNGLE